MHVHVTTKEKAKRKSRIAAISVTLLANNCCTRLPLCVCVLFVCVCVLSINTVYLHLGSLALRWHVEHSLWLPKIYITYTPKWLTNCRATSSSSSTPTPALPLSVFCPNSPHSSLNLPLCLAVCLSPAVVLIFVGISSFALHFILLYSRYFSYF